MPWFLENGTDLAAKKNRKVREPEEFRVIMLNDDYTTMDFVVTILVQIFHKNAEEANRIMMDIHRTGRGTAGIYPFDIARTKAEQAHAIARQHEFPLQCLVEKI
ncbi:MAG: ATP-dependent Clp protease adaptor ClpS [Treponema sp.]|jgi:ATP-dependent Clp protease adaptor protein ClpS|nr:ATP-dependent Clp protease adaptor ClpS [Treponema sp.]